MTCSPLSYDTISPRTLFEEFSEPEDSVLPCLDDITDPDGWRARRRSEKKAARVLGIPTLSDDGGGDMDSAHHAFQAEGGDTSYHGPEGGRRASLSHLNLSSLSLREPARGFTRLQSMSEDDVPLLGAAARGARRTKPHRRLGRHLLKPFRLARAKARKIGRGRSDGDKMEWADAEGGQGAQEEAVSDVEMEDADEDEGDGSVPGEGSPGALVPRTPRKVRYASVPLSPHSTPPSAKSRRSTSSWLRTTPRTPCSAKSWRTDGSPGSDFSPSSGGSTLQRRNKRRRARNLVSESKCLQLLGPEASAAVARATNVNETKLRYRDFGRQLHERLRRDL
ncbi:hypothetical protein BC628DRAFT_1422531 [Trametes gibbosa]|nr:hypothetical protein BC628DRAFT_1422531 [Trametes gibbosa]